VKVAVVIPAYNEALGVGAVVEQACALGQVIVVDDASTDNTAAVARAAGAMVVRHPTNRGYDGALASGFDAAVDLDVDAILTMDADGQHVPETGHALIELITADLADVAVGRRPTKARWSEHVFAFYTRLRFALPDPLCGMKAYRSEIVRQHRTALEGTTIGAGLTIAALASGARLAIVPIPIRRRADTSRFGSGFRANQKILRGLCAAIAIDVRTLRSRTSS
jgi:glycosyltransferase involved in cell wall biosynthesis